MKHRLILIATILIMMPTILSASATVIGSQNQLTFGLINCSGEFFKQKQITDIIGLIDIAGYKHIEATGAKIDNVVATMESSDVIVFITHGMKWITRDSIIKHLFLIREYTASVSEFNNLKDNYITDGYHHQTDNQAFYDLNYTTYVKYEFNSDNENVTIKEYYSEDYFKNVELKKNAIVFFGICSTLDDNNDNVANIFLNKGAIAYLGYDNETQSCGWACKYFIEGLLKGMTIDQAFSDIPEIYRNENIEDNWLTHSIRNMSIDFLRTDFGRTITHFIEKIKNSENGYTTHLIRNMYIDNLRNYTYFDQTITHFIEKNKNSENGCTTHLILKLRKSDSTTGDYRLVCPQAKAIGYKIDHKAGVITFHGMLDEIKKNKLLNCKVGFIYWKDGDRDHAKTIECNNISNCNEEYATFHTSIKTQEFSLNTKYCFTTYLQITNEDIPRSGDHTKIFEIGKSLDSFRDYLVRLYHDTNGDQWIRKDNWCSDKPITEWYGVYSSAYSGYLLDLHNNNLNGSVDMSSCQDNFTLELDDNNIKSINCQCSGIVKLSFPGTVKDINISNCPNIESLYSPAVIMEGEEFQLRTVNASFCDNLKDVKVKSPNLQSLNLMCCSALYDVRCNDSNLYELDLTNCISLDYLECARNKLTSLRVDSPAITSIHCSGNNLVNLILIGCNKLQYIECHDNYLENICIPNLSSLESLTCTNNHISCLITKELYDFMVNGGHFTYDEKYFYEAVFYHGTGYIYEVSETNTYGFYYPGEPMTGGHRPPIDWK